ncbi:hypothetical protein AB0362_06505 [Rhodococcus sp. NPDC079359]|uniref:hypothetical protein n=1 Tax=Rhodococcus sp. NPDC079359 TaxID=3154961 RepID=UPI00344B2033
MARPSWTTSAVCWPIVGGVVYACWSLFRSASVVADGGTVVYALLIGAVLGGIVGCATYVGGTWALKVIDGEHALTARSARKVVVFAILSAATAGATIFAIFALSRQIANAGAPTAVVVGLCFFLSLTYSPTAIREREDRKQGKSA